MKKNLIENLGAFFRIFILFLLAVTILATFVPFSPHMPGTGLDLSWVYSINQAIAQNLIPGQDIIFTFGPYASIYTKAYHPVTDHLMLFGSFYLALCYIAALLLLVRGSSFYWLFAYIVIFAALIHLRDALLFSYPVLLALIVYRETLLPRLPVLIMALLFAPLGLILLIKSSFLPMASAIVLLSFLIFWYTKKRKMAWVCIMMPLVSIVIFWILSGQPLIGLPSFILGSLPIISGYSEAMAIDGRTKEIIAYFIPAIGILYIVATVKAPVASRLFLFFSFAAFLFVAFKAGFVRHDAHAIIASTFLLMLVAFAHTSLQHKRLNLVLILAVLSWAFIDVRHLGTSTVSIYDNLKNTYISKVEGIKNRFSDENILENQFQAHRSRINQEFFIPKMDGTTDIYSYNQAYLLASENTWSPRPIFQSYSAYTPELARINEAHLTGDQAPDNVLFKVETIDSRLPSLDDGLSWPTLIKNYEPINHENDYLYLKKKMVKNVTPLGHEIYNETHTLGEKVSLPNTPGFLFAKIDIEPTLLGRLISILYKPTPLEISVELTNGAVKNYRFISSMAKSGFIISPLIENTSEFALLFADTDRLNDRYVKSIRITTKGPRSLFWKPSYSMQLSYFE